MYDDHSWINDKITPRAMTYYYVQELEKLRKTDTTDPSDVQIKHETQRADSKPSMTRTGLRVVRTENGRAYSLDQDHNSGHGSTGVKTETQ